MKKLDKLYQTYAGKLSSLLLKLFLLALNLRHFGASITLSNTLRLCAFTSTRILYFMIRARSTFFKNQPQTTLFLALCSNVVVFTLDFG